MHLDYLEWAPSSFRASSLSSFGKGAQMMLGYMSDATIPYVLCI